MTSHNETVRRVFLVEIEMPKGRFSSQEVERTLHAAVPEHMRPVAVWGVVEGVDAAYRKLRKLSRETEEDASYGDRVHSAHKAMSFFQDMFPASFWKWKLIGEDHPTKAEKRMTRGR
ncbi:MAG: hypothetical protein AAGA37_19870 [Actinomycetota bacterium]